MSLLVSITQRLAGLAMVITLALGGMGLSHNAVAANKTKPANHSKPESQPAANPSKVVKDTAPQPAEANGEFQTLAEQAILIDVTSNQILFQKNPDTQVDPASMTKLMTIYLTFERLKSGVMTLDQKALVSEKAWRMGGSKMFVALNSQVSIEELIQGVVVQSGNDATIVLAEAMAGSEEAFADLMTARAQSLGLSHSRFLNASGWPEEGHYSTVHDLARLAMAIIHDFPEYYHYFSEKEFTYNGIHQPNRNLLLDVAGVDGLKTGHVEKAGYGMVLSAERQGRRLLLVVHGLTSENERKLEAGRLLEYGYSHFAYQAYYDHGEQIAEVPVWLGKLPKVGVTVTGKVAFTLPRADKEKLAFRLTVTNPVPAPISEGQELGRLEVMVGDKILGAWPVKASTSVEKLGFFGRIGAAFHHLLFGEAPEAEMGSLEKAVKSKN